MAFDYSKKLTNPVDYPTVPQDEQHARQQFMDLFDEIRDEHNNLVDAVDEHLADIVTDEGGVHGLEVETGTWTPVLAGATMAGTNTYATQIGLYYKIGKLYNIKWQVVLSAKDANMSGNIRISGLPAVPYSGYRGVSFARVSNLIFPAGTSQLLGNMSANIILETIKSDGAFVVLTEANIKDNTAISGSAVFYTE